VMAEPRGHDSRAVARTGGRVGDAPAEGGTVLEEGVLLLDAVPGHLVEALVEDGVGGRSGVSGDGRHVWLQHLAKHQDVGSTAHGIRAHVDRLEEHLGVGAWRLPGG
jgi:hypothetical protein